MKIRGKRLVFLILTIFFGFGFSLGVLVAVVEDSAAINMVFTCAPPFILFLWLYLCKGKDKNPSQSMEISKTPREHEGASIPQESDFLLYATMKRKGEKLPEDVQVCLETTPNGLPFSVALSSGNRMEIHECDANGKSIYRTYGQREDVSILDTPLNIEY